VDQARAEQVRCDGVLIKPFEPRQVIERVRELLEGVKGSPARATADCPRPVSAWPPPGTAAGGTARAGPLPPPLGRGPGRSRNRISRSMSTSRA
jgi:DNA-binding response OmpR family regulator